MSLASVSSDCVDLTGRLIDQLAVGSSSDSSAKRGLVSTVLKFLSSFDGLSIPDSETGLADSIRFNLRSDDRFSSTATPLRFDELYHHFCAVNSDGSFRTKVLVLLSALSRQRGKSNKTKSDFTVQALSSSIQASQFDSPVPNGSTVDSPLVKKTQFINQDRPPQLSQEMILVHDVLFICQGIDGKHIKFNPTSSASSFVLLDPKLKISSPVYSLILSLCELGFLFKKIQHFASTTCSDFTLGRVMDIDEETESSLVTSFTSQAFSYAIQKELSEYYRLMAVLESQATKPEGNLLTLRRLHVWLTEALRKMRILAVLVESTLHLKGGALANSLYAHSQSGGPVSQKFIMKLLKRVSVPLFTMIRTWVFEGEFTDPHNEFFIVDNAGLRRSSGLRRDPGKTFDLWRMGYTLNTAMLPGFVNPSLAQKILRAGKSINFLRSRCGDVEWVQKQAANTSDNQMVSYTNLETLQSLVEEASSRVDQRLMHIMTKKHHLPLHFKAMRRYILLGQGDFVHSLLDCLRGELDKEMSKVSEVAVMGGIRSAIHSSNAIYDDEEVLERLCMKKFEALTNQIGWDVFALDYKLDSTCPLSTVLTPVTLLEYQKVFRLLWKLKRAEDRLNESWRGMKCISRSTSRPDLQLGRKLRSLYLLAFNARTKLAHFCTNFQHYIMFEVLEGAWKDFTNKADQATDLDALIEAHEDYVSHIVSKCLLGSDSTSDGLRNLLMEYFNLIDGFCNTITRLLMDSEQILKFLYSRLHAGQGNWSVDENRGELDDVPGEYYHEMREHFASILEKYDLFLAAFTERVTGEAQIDLRFLMFRLDFDDTCQRGTIDAEAFISQKEGEEEMQE
eukprot:g2425.t1